MPRLRTPSLKMRQNTSEVSTSTPARGHPSKRGRKGVGRPKGTKKGRKSKSVSTPWEEGEGETEVHYGYESNSDADDDIDEVDDQHRLHETSSRRHWSDEEMSDSHEDDGMKVEEDLECVDVSVLCPWVELDPSDIPPLDLPNSSEDIPLHVDYIMDMIEMYELLRSYGRVLKLSPFIFEDFCAAMSSSDNSCLLAEIHMALIRSCLRCDEEEQIHYSAIDSNNAFNIMVFAMDSMTYAEVLRTYLEADRSRGRVPIEILNAINEPNYPFVDISLRAAVVAFLCYRFLDSVEYKKLAGTMGKVHHEDGCRACGKSSGELLPCDTCEAVFHLPCVRVEKRPDQWNCDLCTQNQVRGVSDCIPLDQTPSRQPMRMVPLGRDRHGRIYWFAVRRIIVQNESESELYYYSTAPQLYQLTSRFDPHHLEYNLCKRLCERLEDILEQMAVTLELSIERRETLQQDCLEKRLNEPPTLYLHTENLHVMSGILHELHAKKEAGEDVKKEETEGSEPVYQPLPERMERMLGICDGRLTNNFWSGHCEEEVVLQCDTSIPPSSSTLFRMGSIDDGGFRKYINVCALHDLADTPSIRKKAADKKKYMSSRFSLCDEGDGQFQWSMAKGKDMYGNDRLQTKYMEWTLSKMAKRVPSQMMHRKWREAAEKFKGDLSRADSYESLSEVLLTLECAMRRTLFHAQFWNSLGLTRLSRTTVEDRELQSKEVQRRKKEEKELSVIDEDDENLIKVNYTRLPSHACSQGLWRQKDETYRVSGRGALGGWLWVSKALVRNFQPIPDRPPLGVTELDSNDQLLSSPSAQKALRLNSIANRLISWRKEEEMMNSRRRDCVCYSPTCRLGIPSRSVCSDDLLSGYQSCYSQSCRLKEQDIDGLLTAVAGNGVTSDTRGPAKARDVYRVSREIEGVVGEDVPFPLLKPNTFLSRGSRRRSLFVIDDIVLRKLARQGGRVPIYIPQFSLSAKSNFTVWNYPCQRPCFDLCWRWLVRNARSLQAVALQMKILWYCIKWAEFNPSEDDEDDGRVITHHPDRDELRRIIAHKEFKPLGTYERYLLEIEAVSLEEEGGEDEEDAWDDRTERKRKNGRSSTRVKRAASRLTQRKRIKREEWVDGVELKVCEIRKYWSEVEDDLKRERLANRVWFSSSLMTKQPTKLRQDAPLLVPAQSMRPTPPRRPAIRLTAPGPANRANPQLPPPSPPPLALLTEKRKRQIMQTDYEDYAYDDVPFEDFAARYDKPAVPVVKRGRPFMYTTNSRMNRLGSPSRRTSQGYEYDGGMIRGGGRMQPVGDGMRRVVQTASSMGSAAQMGGAGDEAVVVSSSSTASRPPRIVRVAAGGGANGAATDEPPVITRYDSQGGSYGAVPAPRTAAPTRQIIYAQPSAQRSVDPSATAAASSSSVKPKVLLIRRSDGSTQFLRPVGKDTDGVATVNEAPPSLPPQNVTGQSMQVPSDHAGMVASSDGVRRVMSAGGRGGRAVTVMRSDGGGVPSRVLRIGANGQQYVSTVVSSSGNQRMISRAAADPMDDQMMMVKREERGVVMPVRRPAVQVPRTVVAAQRAEPIYYAADNQGEEYPVMADHNVRTTARPPARVAQSYGYDQVPQRVVSRGGMQIHPGQRRQVVQNKDVYRKRPSPDRGARRVTSYKEFCIKRGIVDNVRLPSRPYRFDFESNEDEERAIAEAIAREEEIMRQEEESKRAQDKSENNWQHPRIIDRFGQVSSNMFNQLSKQPLNYSSNLMPTKDDSSDQKGIKQMLDSLLTQVCRWDKQFGWYKSHVKRPRHRMEIDKMSKSRRFFSNQREVLLAEHVERLRREINKRRTRMENVAEEEAGLPTPWRRSRGRNRAARRHITPDATKTTSQPSSAPPRKILNPAEISLGGDSVDWTQNGEENGEEQKVEEEANYDEMNDLVEDVRENSIPPSKKRRETQAEAENNEQLAVGDWVPKRKGPVLSDRLRKIKTRDDASSADESSSTRSLRRRSRLNKQQTSLMPDMGDELDSERGDGVVEHPVPAGMDPQALHCICQKKYNPYKFYLACDLCSRWFHGKCVGVTEQDAQSMPGWSCFDCAQEADRLSRLPQLYCKCRQPYDDTLFYVGCDGCEGWFHPACVGITQASAEKMEEYLCPDCTEAQAAEEAGYESAGSSSSGTSQILSRADYLLVWRLLDVLSDHRMAWPFRQPVNTEEFPTYLEVVSKPIDLSTIQKKLEDLEYSKMKEFTRDVTQMFENARLFNPKDSSIYQCADTLERVFEHHLAEVRMEIEARLLGDREKESEEGRAVDSSLDIDTDQLIDVNLDVDPSMYEQLL